MAKIGPGAFKGSDYRPDVRNPLPGLYRARVENNRDPEKIGRVQIRVPQLHGILDDPDGFIKTEDLPWATPGIFAAAAYDMGQFLVPHVGTIVWVAFEAGDPNRPVYFGGIPSTGGNGKQMNHIGNYPKDGHPDYMGPWTAPTEGDAPKEIYTGRSANQDITRGVIFKSPKGHAIYYDDTDGKESFTIVDRAGQVIQLYCPVPVGDNKANAKRRGNKSALNDTQLKEASTAYIMLKSSELIIKQAKSHVKIEPNKVTVKSEDIHGNVADITVTPTTIRLSAKNVKITADSSITLNAPSVTANGEDLSVDKT